MTQQVGTEFEVTVQVDEPTQEVSTAEDTQDLAPQPTEEEHRPRPAIGLELRVPETVDIRICQKSGHVTFRTFQVDGEWVVRSRNDPHGGLVLRTKDKLILGKPYIATVERYTRHGKGNSAWVKLRQEQ